MEHRHLGRSGLKVSEIAYGNWITHGSQVEEEAARTCVAAALDEGITTFDTADVYAGTRAEDVLGRALHGVRRESIEVCTKVFWPTGPGANDRGLSRKHIMESAHASLRRLQTDYIDLYQAHRYDHETPLAETMRAFDDLVRQGKVLYIGVSEWRAEEIAAALRIADEMGFDRLVSNQPQYNMIWRVIESEVIPLSEREGVGQIVWSPIAQGVLTGKYQPGQPVPAGSRATDPSGSGFIQRLLDDAVLRQVADLAPIAADAGLSMAQLAVAWVLQNRNVSAAIIGATRPEQVRENVKASGVVLEPDLLKRIDEVLGPGHPARPGPDPEPAIPLLARPRRRQPAVRVQAHRAVFDAALFQQGYLVHAAGQQVAPVLAQPALRVALAAERLPRHSPGRHQAAVGLLELPAPGHARHRLLQDPRVATVAHCPGWPASRAAAGSHVTNFTCGDPRSG